MLPHCIGHCDWVMASSMVDCSVDGVKEDWRKRSFCWPVFCQSCMNLMALTLLEMGREFRYWW